MAQSGHGRGQDAPGILAARTSPRSTTTRQTDAVTAARSRHAGGTWPLVFWLVAAAVAAVTLPGAVRAEEPAAVTGPVALGDAVTFHGRGYGHGVGMSQYGARGRALAGQDAATILGHYYQGAQLSPIDPATRIRVLVLSRWAASPTRPLVLHGRVTAWTVDGIAGIFPADARLQLTPGEPTPAGTPPAWRLLIDDPAGAVLHDGPAPLDFTVRGVDDTSVLQVRSKPTSYNRYRGVLRVIVHSASRVSVVNDVLLDAYLGGVVPVEMPSTWPAAALQAQAVAARSYAARRLRPGISYFDVPDDSTSQIYRGVLAEKATTNAAIAVTANTVLVAGTTIANALFHSTGGGATESNENVYTSASGKRTGRPVSYLRGGPDRDETGAAYDARAPYATWSSRTYERAELSAIFAADPRTSVGDLLALDLRDRGVSGRLVSVTLIGTAGSRTVSGEVFRAVFNARRPAGHPILRSTLLDLAPIP